MSPAQQNIQANTSSSKHREKQKQHKSSNGKKCKISGEGEEGSNIVKQSLRWNHLEKYYTRDDSRIPAPETSVFKIYASHYYF